MTPEQFDSGMNKLKRVYGDKAYPTEREDVIYREVRGLSEMQWVRMTNELVGTHRQPPMLEEFRISATKTRERFVDQEKQNEQRDLTKVVLNSEELRSILKETYRAMNGEILKDDFKNFTRGFTDFVQTLNPAKCKICMDTGTVTKEKKSTGSDYIFKCTCSASEPFKFNSWPTWNLKLTEEYQ